MQQGDKRRSTRPPPTKIKVHVDKSDAFRLKTTQPQYRKLASELSKVGNREPYIQISMDNPNRLRYEDKNEKLKNNKTNDFDPVYRAYQLWIHKGQRKLFMSEVQHMTYVLDSHLDHAILVYIGAAPNNKAWLVHQMFPNVKIIFVDPNPFDIKIKKNINHITDPNHGIVYFSTNERKTIKYFNGIAQLIAKPTPNFGEDPLLSQANFEKYARFIFESDNSIFINQQLFLPESGEFIRYLFDYSSNYPDFAGCKTIFWSDIRSGGGNEWNDNPSDLNVMIDSFINLISMKVVEADYSMIKFRGMFNPLRSLDELESYLEPAKKYFDFDFGPSILAGDVPFYRGIIYNQCWRGRYSTETRLWVDKQTVADNDIIVYNSKDFDDINYYYNALLRTTAHFSNPFAPNIPGMDDCGDCAIEGKIWSDYAEKYNQPISEIQRYEAILNQIYDRPL